MGKHRNQKIKPKLVEEVGSSDDEEIDEDEAFNSEDERKYGSFFEGGDDSDTSEHSESESDSEGSEGVEGDDQSKEGDGGQYMLDLLGKLDSDKKSGGKDGVGERKVAANVKESEFSASVLPSANLTLDSLMTGLEDTNGFGVMQKKLKTVAQGRAVSTPLSRVASERAKRQLHYDEQQKDMSNWIDAVQENRKAETLDFRPKERMEVTRDILVDKFVPTTPFEKELHAALEQAGELDEEAMLKREEKALQDDLGGNEITMEEYRKRHGELAKLRALMFYHEQKRHHMKKIKSKKYRRIRKKQRLREKEGELEVQMDENPDLASELQEKEELARMKERMTLGHKNTSKWAKRVLKRGKNVDVDTRRALSAQLKRGDDLRKKMTTTNEEDDDDDSDEDLIETARKVLNDTENDKNDDVQANGLFKLAFMQRGVEKQKERAREEARQLMMELEGNEEDVEPEKDANSKKRHVKQAGTKEMQSVLSQGDLVASSLKFGSGSTSVAVSGRIDVDLGDDSPSGSTPNGSKRNSQYTTTIEAKQTSEPKEKESNRAKKSSKALVGPVDTQKSSQQSASNEDESNPWLQNSDSHSSTTPAKKASGFKKAISGGVSSKGMVDVDKAVDAMCPTEQETMHDALSTDTKTGDETTKKITMLTQEELVKRAFVTPSDDLIDEEFAAEKREMEEREESGKKKKRKQQPDAVSGWGSWTGKGAPAPKPPRKLPASLMPPKKKQPEKRKRADAQRPHVIISQRRMKRMTDNYMISEIPYPFTSREDYERAMAGGVGKEWNVTGGVKDMSRPEIMTRPGKIIQPLSKKVKRARPAAKF